jgi:hypothetical protein
MIVTFRDGSSRSFTVDEENVDSIVSVGLGAGKTIALNYIDSKVVLFCDDIRLVDIR